jgi:hypothetical protein
MMKFSNAFHDYLWRQIKPVIQDILSTGIYVDGNIYHFVQYWLYCLFILSNAQCILVGLFSIQRVSIIDFLDIIHCNIYLKKKRL